MSKNGKTSQTGEGALVSEIVGRTTSPYPRQVLTHRLTVDRTQVDYAWWSRFRRGKEPGFELGSVFARPILNIVASWVLGQAFEVESENETAADRLAQFVSDELDTLLTWYSDGLALGDSYLVVNADGSLTMLPPNTVEIITDPFDYRTVLAYKVTTKLETVTIVDEYRADRRIVTIQATDERGVMTETPLEFANPLGMIPVVHFANEREANEVNGHPVYEGLLHWFTRYDDLLNKTLDGVEVMGRPIPVAITDDAERDRELNSTRTEDYVDKDGTTRTEKVVDFAELDMFWLNTGGDFKFAAPGPFAQDSKSVGKWMFYLMLEHTGIPEWAWGGAIASSMASVEAQMPAFVRLIERWRKALAGPLMELLTLWYASVALFEFLPAVDNLSIQWPEVTPGDDEILVKKIAQASLDNLLTRETELRLLDLGIDDPAAEVEAAQKEADEREQQFEETVNTLMQEREMNEPQGTQEREAA